MHQSRLAAVFALVLTVAAAPGAYALQRQTGPRAPAAAAAPEPPAVGRDFAADETRQHLQDVLRQYPPTLWQVLRMDPSLLSNEAYLQPYPALSTFLAQHPEVAHNPGYFLGQPGRGDFFATQTPKDRAVEMSRDVVQGLAIGTLLLTLAGGLLWVIKTLIEYRRWTRLTKVHTEVHNKLLDRFTSNEDLLAYIQTPAGRKFLEASPIAIDSPRAVSAPLGRILWSAQAGAILTVLGLGVEVVARFAMEELAGALAGVGAIVIALGVGFLVSAVIAYVLSRRFGLITPPAAALESRD